VLDSVFIRRKFFALVSTPLLALGAGVLAIKPGAVRKVAVMSVTGPADWQETIDVAEAWLVSVLRAKGLAVVSLADSKSFTSANWQAAYSNVQAGKPMPVRNGNTGLRASRNTLLLADPGQSAGQRHPGEVRLPIRQRHPGEVRLPIRQRHPGEVRLPIRQRGYSATFCKTAGELSRQMGADAAVLLTISASRVVQILMIDQAGTYVFREQVQWDSKNAVTGAISQELGRYPNLR
jgi:hypothetical protein